MKIGDLSRETGVDVETIRYYEKAGLLPPPAREANGYRRYAHAHVERLAFVRHCRALDIPLAQVRVLLQVIDGGGPACPDVDELLDSHLRRVRARLDSLRALERQLARLRDQCDAAAGGKPCGILQELVAAAQGEACACHGAPAGA